MTTSRTGTLDPILSLPSNRSVQYIPHTVRSLNLWWFDPVSKLTHALCGVGRQCVAIEPEEEIVLLLSLLTLVKSIAGKVVVGNDIGTSLAGNVCAVR